MSAAIKASGFAELRLLLKDATDEQLTATQAYWAALPGLIAAKHRHLIDEEIEVRQAVAHDIETAHAALVAAMAPTRQCCTIGCDDCGGRLDWEFWSDGTTNLCSGCKPVPDEQVTR